VPVDVRGKVALVTGAGIRVGREIALALAGLGMHIAIHYNASRAAAERTADVARELGVEAESLQADLGAMADEARKLVGAVEHRWGRLDVLVNSAAIFPRTPWESIDEETWDRTLAVNLKGPFFTAWHAVDLMRRGGGGSIVNIADWAGLRPYKNYLPYVISKGGIITMTRALAKELAPQIRVNAVAPGPVLMPEEFDPRTVDRVVEGTLLKRLGNPADVAEAVVFLVSRTDFVTGHVLVVDGGRLIG
jgi:pteridine reductase